MFHLRALPLRPTFRLLALLALPFAGCGTVDTASITSLTGDATAGKTLYASNCQSCHGSAGTTRANAVSAAKSNASGAASVILTGDGEMPSFSSLSNQSVADLLAYLKTL